MKKLNQLLITIYLLFFQFFVFAQNNEIKGTIIDFESNKPLAFVNIVYNNKNQGIISDMDGKFTFSNIDRIDFLKFSYLGYKTIIINKEAIYSEKFLTVRMENEDFKIDEVVVFPGENPAHRIINRVIENNKINNPENLPDYKYMAYNKMIFTMNLEQPENDYETNKPDSAYIKMKSFLENQHIFMMESISERKYKKPGKINEIVLASKVSGLKYPSFILLATQLQSFSFYDDMITLLDSRYVNPVSNGSTNRYFFNIEDTTISERGDTVFSISFKPKKNKNFEGLSGILNINTYKYAIQSVLASPVETNGILDIKIMQNYKLINDEFWFPSELNTDLLFGNLVKSPNENIKTNLIGIGKSYITNIEVNKQDENTKFKAIELEANNSAFRPNDSLWMKYRIEPLSMKEIKTYEVMDSIGKENNLDLKLKTIKTISLGYIPVSFINLSVLSLLDFNVYEGFRPGIGFITNEKLSPHYSIGSNIAYGFKDERIKYGGLLLFNLSPQSELKITLEYKNDVMESSGYSFFNENIGFNSSDAFRYYLIKDMTYINDVSASLSLRVLKGLKVNLLARKSIRNNTSPYFLLNNASPDEPGKLYHFSETAIQFKYAPNEKLAWLAGEIISSNPNNSPVFYFNLFKGFNNQTGEFDYLKMEGKIDLSFLTKSFGKTGIQIVAGKVLGELPYFMQYNGHESYYDFTIETANSFASMRMNEFLSDEFLSIHFRQDLGNLLFKFNKFKPKVILATSAGFGKLHHPELHNAIIFKTMEKGYYESGILINIIIRQLGFIGYGFGIFYRYGPYSYSNNSDNFAYKLTMTFDL